MEEDEEREEQDVGVETWEEVRGVKADGRLWNELTMLARGEGGAVACEPKRGDQREALAVVHSAAGRSSGVKVSV